MTQSPLMLVARGARDLSLLTRYANRHGLIAGATGTGKSVSLMLLAEEFSKRGVPVFLADVKGDLAGLSQSAVMSDKLRNRLKLLGIEDQWKPGANPVVFWDIYGQNGHPLRTTISEMGPILLSRLMELNEVQAGVLNVVFRVADEEGLLLLDLPDLRAMLNYVSENAKAISAEYGLVSATSIAAVQRALLGLEDAGARAFFGEPAFELRDFFAIDPAGRGVINVMAAEQLIMKPKLYSSFLLWLLSELFEQLPEVGDLDKPRLVFFFDEAHLLFDDAPPSLVQRVEQVVRLIRSKGVGVYFCSQNPDDVPGDILGQLGHRIQHALRAFTPRDQKAVNAIAETMRPNPKLNVKQAILELSVGEALVSFLDADGSPGVTERALIVPPVSQIGPITTDERKELMQSSIVAGVYEQEIDRESAFELLQARSGAEKPHGNSAQTTAPGGLRKPAAEGILAGLGDLLLGSSGKRGGRRESVLDAFAKSAARSVGSSIAREITRGVLGSILGQKRR